MCTSRGPTPPPGDGWLHEIKHDGYRMLVWRDGETVRLYTRGGHDWSKRFPSVVDAARRLPLGERDFIILQRVGFNRRCRRVTTRKYRRST
jgi:ATP-dependent DNA ligase